MASPQQSLDIDNGYGATAEEALLAVLKRQPAFDSHDVKYPDGRPDFMDVNVKEINQHDWEAYNSSSDYQLTPERDVGPVVQTTQPYDPLSDKIRLSISNIWAEVNWNDDGRADVKFQLSIELEKSQWTGESRVGGELDKTWKCERMSTEPK